MCVYVCEGTFIPEGVGEKREAIVCLSYAVYVNKDEWDGPVKVEPIVDIRGYRIPAWVFSILLFSCFSLEFSV